MEQLTVLDGIDFRILQRGPALASWRGRTGAIPIIHDVLEEAAELLSLDLLVCVDTLSAHLAGALGVPTWLLLPMVADWRWMEHRDDTPWYPTMRLFRQRQVGDWGFRADAAWAVRERDPDFWPLVRADVERIRPGVLLIAEASARDSYYMSHGFDAAYDWTGELGLPRGRCCRRRAFHQ